MDTKKSQLTKHVIYICERVSNLSIYLSHLSINPAIYLYIYLSYYPTIYLSIQPPIYIPILSIYPSSHLSIYIPILSIYPSSHVTIHVYILSIQPSIYPATYLSTYLSFIYISHFSIYSYYRICLISRPSSINVHKKWKFLSQN